MSFALPSHRAVACTRLHAIVVMMMAFVAVPSQSQTQTPPTVESIRAKAEGGDADAQFSLGDRYEKGDGLPADGPAAVMWITKAAEQGNVRAQVRLAFYFEYGWAGVSKDAAQAVKWYARAAEQGDSGAQWSLGGKYKEGRDVPRDMDQAIKWLTKAAEQGNPDRQFELGVLYRNGDGVSRDSAQAIKWLTKAAEQGNVRAQYSLGYLYGKNSDVRDAAEAVKWYTRAAQQGEGASQVELGECYSRGDGVPLNFILAYSWYSIAAANGQSGQLVAQNRRDAIAEKMTREQIAEAQRISTAFKPRSEHSPVSIARDGQIADASGSGFFVTANGYVVTNHHVVADARRVTVRTATGTFPAKIVQRDPANDLALLKVECTATALHVRGSRGVKIADRVSTIGYPNPAMQGLSAKFSSGEISSIDGPGDDPRLFQISVPIQPGNSGGPLVDEAGLVVGVIVAKLDQLAALKQTGQLPENVNYAIKASLLAAFLESVPDVADKLVPLPPTKPGEKVDPTQAVQPATVMVQVYK